MENFIDYGEIHGFLTANWRVYDNVYKPIEAVDTVYKNEPINVSSMLTSLAALIQEYPTATFDITQREHGIYLKVSIPATNEEIAKRREKRALYLDSIINDEDKIRLYIFCILYNLDTSVS